MSVTILIPAALRTFTQGSDSVFVQAATVQDALEALVGKFPGIKKHMYNERGELRHFVNIFVNEDDIRFLSDNETALREGDVLSIVPSVAGGAVIGSVAADVDLTPDELRRYNRHLIMPEVALDGQKRLKAAQVLLIGAGGLGSPLALYLAAAGVGRLGIVDFDTVDFTNLQRQIIHSTESVGRSKLESAKARIGEINPNVRVDTYEAKLTSDNAIELFAPYDIVVDGTDNFPTRYLVNDACVLSGKPNVYGSIFRFEGQATVFYAKEGPCYRCLYPEPPPPGLVPSCAEGGVLGVLPGVIGVIQAIETVKLILGKGDSLIGRLILFDALKMKFRELRLRKNPKCSICGENPVIRELIDYDEFCGISSESQDNAPDVVAFQISPLQLKAKMDRGEYPVIIDVREPHEYAICKLPGSRLIPLHTLPEHLHEFSTADEIVVHCRSGGRSAKAVDLLRQAGHKKVRNLAGGILRWSDEVDPTVTKY